jgi:hypothetical protein
MPRASSLSRRASSAAPVGTWDGTGQRSAEAEGVAAGGASIAQEYQRGKGVLTEATEELGAALHRRRHPSRRVPHGLVGS